MKETKITPGSNLMWESSRFMIREHVDAYKKQQQEQKKKARPMFDQQHLEEVERMVRDYIMSDINLAIIIFGEYEDKEYNARITAYDPQLRRMKLEWDDEFEWVQVEDIVDIFT